MLPKTLWKLLRKFALARTPREERTRLFAKSETVEINADLFYVSILRALKASLLLDQKTEDINIQFVKGGETEIDLLFRKEEKLLQVHEKWVDFQRVHEAASCEVFRFMQEQPIEMQAFFCDHVVEDLFELALNDTRGSLELDQAKCVRLRRVARERIRQMPRLIKVSRTVNANELEVSWTGNESGMVSKMYGADIRYYIILHRMNTCSSKKGALLHQAGTYPSPEVALQMPWCLVDTRRRTVPGLSRKQFISNRGDPRILLLLSSSCVSKRLQGYLQRPGPQGRVFSNDCSN
jgi:hypothetical protein